MTSAVARTISENYHFTICGLLGTYNEIHMNKTLMNNSDHGGLIVPGVATSVIMLGLRRQLPAVPNISAIYGFDRVRFLSPLIVDETVYLSTEILDLEPREADPETGLLREKEDLYRTEDGTTDGGELVASREGLYLVKRRNVNS
jgi:acyl dehydratase